MVPVGLSSTCWPWPASSWPQSSSALRPCKMPHRWPGPVCPASCPASAATTPATGGSAEIRGQKSPHWTGKTNSPATFGHFGQSGSFLWVDPVANIAVAGLSEADFGPWAKQAWPALADAVLTVFGLTAFGHQPDRRPEAAGQYETATE